MQPSTAAAAVHPSPGIQAQHALPCVLPVLAHDPVYVQLPPPVRAPGSPVQPDLLARFSWLPD